MLNFEVTPFVRRQCLFLFSSKLKKREKKRKENNIVVHNVKHFDSPIQLFYLIKIFPFIRQCYHYSLFPTFILEGEREKRKDNNSGVQKLTHFNSSIQLFLILKFILLYIWIFSLQEKKGWGKKVCF